MNGAISDVISGPLVRDMTTHDHQGVTAGHFTLTGEQRRFKAMLGEYPHLVVYWDFAKRECRLDARRGNGYAATRRTTVG